MRQRIPLWLTAAVGLVMFLYFFVPPPLVAGPGHFFEQSIIIVVAFAVVLGAANVVQFNGEIILRRGTDWPYKVVLLVVMFAMMGIGLAEGPRFLEPETKFSWMYANLYSPMQATMYALLAFYIASAAFRAFRIRTLEAGLLAAAALIVMLGRVPLGDVFVRAIFDHDGVPHVLRALRISTLQEWVMDVPQNAAKRAVLIGAAMGIMATGLRVILGIERSYLGGGD